MPITTPPTITPAPNPAPQRNDRTTFSTRVDAFVTWLIAAVAQFAALAANVYNNAVEAFNYATTASAKAGEAQAAATAAAAAAGASKWVAGTNYAEGVCTWSPTDGLTYRHLVAGVSNIDPKLDPNWKSLTSDVTLADLHTAIY